MIIESLNLREIDLSGRQLTWANRRDTPTFEKLDRILASVEWEQKFRLVSVHALPRTRSDHTPLLLDSGNHAHIGNKPNFSFELAWFNHDGFYDMIAAEWAKPVRGNTPIERWLDKIRYLRRFLKGWEKNQSEKYKKEKQSLLKLIDELDIKVETVSLTDTERVALREPNDRISKLRHDQETKWAQRANVKHVQEGRKNTKYFHLVANGKRRKKKIFQLEQNLKFYISEYYKKLFGAPAPNNFSLLEDLNQDIPQLTDEENSILMSKGRGDRFRVCRHDLM